MYYRIPISRPWIQGEEARLASQVIESGWLISGPRVKEFESCFASMLGARFAVAVNSGSSALLVSMISLGIGPQDEVIVPDMTFVSTASSLLFLGAKPVFVDINLENYCIDTSKIEAYITSRTKAIVPVHYAGHSADMDEIIDIATKHGLYVLEDAAEAHLSKYKGRYVGTIGDMGIFSFTPSKLMTTGEGGMIITNNERLAQKARLVRNFSDKGQFSWEGLGFNFRMPDIMGAIGLVQIRQLKQAVKIRRELAKRYDTAFSNLDYIHIPQIRSLDDTNYQLYTLRIEIEKLKINRNQIIQILKEAGIQTRLYYPALHKQKVFSSYGPYKDSNYPNTIKFEKEALSLPIYPELKKEEQDYIIEKLLTILKTYKND
jgi:dTDP-4-amino-4,6-dideoxygalactose transaminase